MISNLIRHYRPFRPHENPPPSSLPALLTFSYFVNSHSPFRLFPLLSLSDADDPRALGSRFTRHIKPTLTSSLLCTGLFTLSAAADMGSLSDTVLYPLHRCKIIHLVRHAEGLHNVAEQKGFDELLSYDYLDASLTPLGWEQVDNLRKLVLANGISQRIELVITSPLTRTMQTAVGVFGGEGYTNGIDATPLMVQNVENSGRPSISSLNCPPFLAVELCRERLGRLPCNKRRSVSTYKSLFPGIDFSLVETDEDTWWKEEPREEDEDVGVRGMKFMEWLWTREEKEIAIVSHSALLYNTLNAMGKNCHPNIKGEICTRHGNCELRSLVIVDRG